MSVKVLTEHRLEFVSLKGGCAGSSESTLVKMPHCWNHKSRLNFRANACETLGTLISQRKGKFQTSTTNLVFQACSVPFHSRVHKIVFLFLFFFMQTHEKETQLNWQLCIVC